MLGRPVLVTDLKSVVANRRNICSRPPTHADKHLDREYSPEMSRRP